MYHDIWMVPVPLKAKIMVSLTIRGRLNTKDLLASKGAQIAVVCILCGEEDETQTHLFLKCQWVTRIWASIKFRLCIVSDPVDILSLWSDWRHNAVSCQKKMKWDIWACAIL